jgi:ABC-type uncharacterized transport system permease subunit
MANNSKPDDRVLALNDSSPSACLITAGVTAYALMLFTFRQQNSHFVGFEVSTAVVMKSVIFWDMMPYSPLSLNRSFGDGGDMFLRNVG